MQLQGTTMGRLMITLPVPLLVVTTLMILAVGDEPPRADQRDREVLEVALKDILDEKNPLHHQGESDDRLPPREITINCLTNGDHDADVLKYQKMITADLATSWRKRNSGNPVPLKKIGLEGKEFRIIDLDKLHVQAQKTNRSFWELFWERYPRSAGCAEVSLPGYSRGGTAAVVVIHLSTDFYHPSVYLTRLAKVEGRWNVGWRHLETY
jgi:hypothetical protein